LKNNKTNTGLALKGGTQGHSSCKRQRSVALSDAKRLGAKIL